MTRNPLAVQREAVAMRFRGKTVKGQVWAEVFALLLRDPGKPIWAARCFGRALARLSQLNTYTGAK